MNARILERWWPRVVSVGLMYLGLGVGSAVISNDLESAPVQASIRVGILLVAVAVFCCHLRVELARAAHRVRASALIASSAVALGTFLLAVYALGLSWWDTSHLPTSLLSALLVWPAATSLPAFLAALGLGSVMARLHRRRKSQ
jgi:nitroreductase